MRVFDDPLGYYASSNPGRYLQYNATYQATGGRWSNGPCTQLVDNNSVAVPFRNATSFTNYLGFAMKVLQFGGGSNVAYLLNSLSQFGLCLQVTSSGALKLGSINTTTLFTSTAGLLAVGVWNYIEYGGLNDTGSSGTATLKLNGETLISLTGAHTSWNLTQPCNTAVIVADNGSGFHHQVQDIYVNDDVNDPIDPSNTKNKGFDGDQRMYYMGFTTNGAQTQMTPNPGSNTNVQNIQDPTGLDDNTTYNAAPTVGLIDMYEQGGVPTTAAVIKCLSIVTATAKDDAGIAAGVVTFGDGTPADNQYDTHDIYAPTGDIYSVARRYFCVNPWTSAAWVKEDFNTGVNGGAPLQIGIKRTI